MDVRSLLSEAADETYDNDDDFERLDDPISSSSKQTATDILKSSATEVDRNDKVEAAKVFQEEAESISREENSRKHVRHPSTDSSPERDVQRDDASSILLKASKEVYANEVRATDKSSRTMDSNDAPEITESDSEADGDENNDDDYDSEADPELDTELLVAAYQGNIRKVLKLMSSGARYFARDRHKWTALMWAAAGGYDDIIESLLSCVKKPKVKSFLNAKDSITGWTALHVSYYDRIYFNW